MANPAKVLYTITKHNGKSFWNKIGVGFVNDDGSVNIKMFGLPVNGEAQLRDYVPREDSYDPAKASTSASRSRRPKDDRDADPDPGNELSDPDDIPF